MTKIIAHRANLFGANVYKENSRNSIKEAIGYDLDVEVDVQSVVDDHILYVGHHKPEYELDLYEFLDSDDRFWFHAKTVGALAALLEMKEKHGYLYDVFFHQNDECTLTSRNFIWLFPTNNPKKGDRNILLLPEYFGNKDLKEIDFNQFYGVCTDIPFEIKDLINVNINNTST